MANLAKASLGAEDDKPVATSISTVLSAVLKSFNATITRNELHMHQDQVPRSLWEDELGRLRVWAANIGAHQAGLSSLDYRLRDASHIKAQIVRLLEGLARKFRHLEEVLDEDPDELDKLDEEADLDHGGVTEIQQIYKALTENINLLFRMSMLIRRPAHHDRLLGTRREDAVIFEPFDRQHVVEKFPRTNTEIANRLGAAISRRRAYLRYRDRHHAKLGKGITEIEDDKTVHASTELSETIATEFREPNFNLDQMETESSYSQTSYAPTLLEGRSTMTVPSPPKGSTNGQPFECPYCFFITTVKDSRSWARHVFKDIMPYVCIFTDCSIPNQLYDSRRDWYRHLVNDHHGWVKNDAQAECPLCQEINLPAPKLERHLGRHLEELALFALPRADADEDLDSNESSHHSSRASETPAESHPSPHDSIPRAEYLTSDPLPSEPGHSPSAHQASIPPTYDYRDEEAPDTLIIQHKDQIHLLDFKPYAISDGLLLVSHIRKYAAEKLGIDPERLRLLYKGGPLKDDNLEAKAYGLKQNSEIMCVVSEGSSTEMLPSPGESNSRNGSRTRKPEGLSIQMVPVQETVDDSSTEPAVYAELFRRSETAGSYTTTQIDTHSEMTSPPTTGNSQRSLQTQSPSVSGRSIDQYISSLEQAQYYSRQHRGQPYGSRDRRGKEDPF